MKNIRSKEDLEHYARLLKNFYGELYAFLLLNAGFILVWLLSGAGYFWPIWPIGIWGIILLIKASKLNIIDSSFYEHCHAFRERVLFMKKDWEEQKVKELLQRAKESGMIDKNVATEEKAKPKKAPTTKPKASPKTTKPAAKKAAPKKAVPKKAAPKKSAEEK